MGRVVRIVSVSNHEQAAINSFDLLKVIISVARCYGLCVFTELSTLRSCERLGPARDFRRELDRVYILHF